jgi:hypothetical protein
MVLGMSHAQGTVQRSSADVGCERRERNAVLGILGRHPLDRSMLRRCVRGDGLLVSDISVWEIGTKVAKGKLSLSPTLTAWSDGRTAGPPDASPATRHQPCGTRELAAGGLLPADTGRYAPGRRRRSATSCRGVGETSVEERMVQRP